MSRTPLMGLFRRALAQTEHAASRRSFIRTTAFVAAAAATPSILQSCVKAASSLADRSVKVAVVGAGLAGLHATWLLKKGNVNVELFEGSKRIGGRAFTGNNLMVENSTAELGGEWLDTNHYDMLSLAKTFGVELIDKKLGDNTVDVFYIDGRSYTMGDIVKAIEPHLTKIAADADRLPADLRDLHASPAKELDAMTMDVYLTSIGVTGWIRSLIDIAFVTEYGLEMNEQSALNLITLIGTDIFDGELKFFGESDERYVMRGGVQGITKGLHNDVTDNTHTNHRLIEIDKDGDAYLLTFQRESEKVTVAAEHVVLALPFTMLRNVTMKVDLPEKKRRVIKELAYGTNGKVLFGFNGRPWSNRNFSGSMYTDPPLQQIWENCHVPNPKGSGLTVFYGGKSAAILRAMPDDALRAMFIKNMQTVWGVAETDAPVRMHRMDWPTQPFVMASYSAFGPGQWTDFYGVAGDPVGKLHFAGEHCSLNHQGYLNGAAETGRIAAERILQSV